MRFGVFMAPFHSLGDNPTLAYERDMQLVELVERLDYDEAWIGEHHSGGAEIIGSPDLFIAAVAERTRRIRLGTGVYSLSFHHPFIVADRMAQLDHQTRGRLMFGVGPGQLPADAFMLGVHPTRQRDMMAESIETMIPLLEGKTVTIDKGWFKLDRARLQVLPYQAPRMEMAVACTFSPNGPMLAGRHGMSMLSVAASSAAGFAALPDHWRICEHVAAENGQKVHRDSWRVVVPIHVAPTREQARAEVAENIMANVVAYVRAVGGEPMRQALEGVENADQAIERWTTTGFGPLGVLTIGTPDDLADRIQQLLDQSGGYGCFMALAHNSAGWDATRRSYELLARHVMPRFQHNDRRRESAEFSRENSGEFIGAVVTATTQTLEKHRDLMEAARSS
jgi:limonene 1,2-monooxygenase